jgi:uncharacterized protein
MRVIDFNVHLPPAPSLEHELNLQAFDAAASLAVIGDDMQRNGVVNGNLMILDCSFLRRGDGNLVAAAQALGLRCTAMVDPREVGACDLVDAGAKAGIVAIKLHPYLLGLHDGEFPKAVALAEHAAAKGLMIAVDCSYGTRRLYDISGVRLVVALAERVKTPIIALHGGGPRVLDVMSLVLDSSNVYLDTSFSIPYWLGSSVEADFAFAIRKAGPQRCLFGSDRPYIPQQQAIRQTLDFMQRHGFGERDIEQLMSGTAQQLLRLD